MAANRYFTSLACFFLFTTSCAHATGIDYTLQAGFGYSDNINESAVDPIGELIFVPRMNFIVDEEGETVQARAVGDIEYRDFLGADFDNELRGQLSSVVNWVISPQRLNFDFEDYAAVQPVNILATNAPNNLQQTNVFTMGPTFTARLDPTWSLQGDLRVTDSVASQTQDFDSNRALAAVRAIKLLDPTAQVSANVSVERVHFTDAVGDPDYQHEDVYARYQRKLAALDLDVALGYTQLEFSHGPAPSGLLTRGAVTWHIDAENTFGVGFARQFSDASQDMRVDPTSLLSSGLGTGIVVGTTAITSQVYLENQLNATYVFQRDRIALRLAPYYNKYDYEAAPELNQTAHGIVAGVTYRLTPLSSLTLDAGEASRTYTNIDRRDEDIQLDLYLAHQFTPHWSGRLDLMRNERNSTALDQGFVENVVMVAAIYKR